MTTYQIQCVGWTGEHIGYSTGDYYAAAGVAEGQDYPTREAASVDAFRVATPDRHGVAPVLAVVEL